MKNRVIAALKATTPVNPMLPRKYTAAPSRIPNSANDIDGIRDLVNITRFAAQI